MRRKDPREPTEPTAEAHQLARLACRGYHRALMLVDGIVDRRPYKWGRLPISDEAHSICHVLCAVGALDLVSLGELDDAHGELSKAFDAAEADANLRTSLYRTGHERTDPLFREAMRTARVPKARR